MKGFSFPSLGSILIFFFFILHKRFFFDANELTMECYRKVNFMYNKDLYTPISIILIIASIVTVFKNRKNVKAQILDYILVAPPLLFLIYSIILLIISFLNTFW